MGNNTAKFDREAYYADKSLKELEDLLYRLEKMLSRKDDDILREEVGYLRLLRAERIGK